MLRKAAGALLTMLLMTTCSGFAEEPDYTSLDVTPYDAEKHPDIDKYIGHWQESMPDRLFGSLVVRDYLTKGGDDPLKPESKGAVLSYLNRLCRGTLAVNEITTPSKLTNEQAVFYFTGGKGRVKAGGETTEVRNGVGILMPPELVFTIENTGDEELEAILFVEPLRDGFKPNKKMKIRDVKTEPIGSSSAHWTHIYKKLFNPDDGTAWLDMGPVWFDAMTMGQPHSHNPGFEEVWISLEGNPNLFLGKEVRPFPAGTAYKIPPDYMTPHSTINTSDKPISVFWFIIRTVPEPAPPSHSMLRWPKHDPEKDTDIDLFTGDWRESTPHHTHGSLVERDIFTYCDGDPVHPKRRDAVLKYFKSFTHATIFPGHATTPFTPEGEQEVYYVLSGKGKLNGGGETFDLYPGIAFMIPEGIEFTMESTGDDYLTMFHMVEPTHEGFKPNDRILVRDENIEPFHTSTAHWVHTNKWLVGRNEGLAEAAYVLTVTCDGMTMGQPHSHGEPVEEVWAVISGEPQVLLGQQIRNFKPGMAYKIPPDGGTPHANINLSNEPVKFFYFARFSDR